MMPYIKTLQKSETQSTTSRTALTIIFFMPDKKMKRNPLSSYNHVGFAVLHLLVLCRFFSWAPGFSENDRSRYVGFSPVYGGAIKDRRLPRSSTQT